MGHVLAWLVELASSVDREARQLAMSMFFQLAPAGICPKIRNRRTPLATQATDFNLQFRQKMIAKVNEAKKFDAEKYVDEYLEDMKYRLVPKTYKVNMVVEFLGHIKQNTH